MVLMGPPVLHKNNLLPYCHEKKMCVKNMEKSKLPEEKDTACSPNTCENNQIYRYGVLKHMNLSSNFENLIIIIMKIILLCDEIWESLT